MGLTFLMRMNVTKLEKLTLKMVKMFQIVRRRISRRKLSKLRRIIFSLLIKRHQIVAPPRNLESPLVKIRKRRRTIDSFDDEEIPKYFRFRTKAQLYRLTQGLHIPDIVRIPATGNIFHGEEYLLVSLYRLHRPTTLSDGCFRKIFGSGHTAVSMAFNSFLDFMIDRWSYLLLDNLDFWKPYLVDCAQAIRNKCVEKGY